MRVGLAAIMLLSATAFAQGQSQTPASVDNAVRAVLQAQVEAWNRHDLEAFMAGYWHSPELTFFSGGTETRGWKPTLERYRRKYQSASGSMGTLSFSDLRVDELGSDAALARGSFHLLMPDGTEPHGLFTLIFRKLPEGWRIVHDHSCAAESAAPATAAPASK
jgi:ketosteroid isomerase-like protein